MSNKIVNTYNHLSTEIVDKRTGEVRTVPRYQPPKLTKGGSECPSDITLVAVPAIRDFDLGVRIRRFQKAPDSVQARLDDYEDMDGVDFDAYAPTDEVNPMTTHELRFGEVQNQLRDKEKERIKQRDDQIAAKLKADKEAFRANYRALLEEGSIPATPPSSPAA